MFGPGHPRLLDRNAKVRIMHWARCLSRRTEKGRAYGRLTAKELAVLEALLWAFHNCQLWLLLPQPRRQIAEAAGCARSSIAGALKALEGCGTLSWVHLGSSGFGSRTPISWATRVALAGLENVECLRFPRSRRATRCLLRPISRWNPNQAFSSSLEAAFDDERRGMPDFRANGTN